MFKRIICPSCKKKITKSDSCPKCGYEFFVNFTTSITNEETESQINNESDLYISGDTLISCINKDIERIEIPNNIKKFLQKLSLDAIN